METGLACVLGIGFVSLAFEAGWSSEQPPNARHRVISTNSGIKDTEKKMRFIVSIMKGYSGLASLLLFFY